MASDSATPLWEAWAQAVGGGRLAGIDVSRHLPPAPTPSQSGVALSLATALQGAALRAVARTAPDLITPSGARPGCSAAAQPRRFFALASASSSLRDILAAAAGVVGAAAALAADDGRDGLDDLAGLDLVFVSSGATVATSATALFARAAEHHHALELCPSARRRWTAANRHRPRQGSPRSPASTPIVWALAASPRAISPACFCCMTLSCFSKSFCCASSDSIFFSSSPTGVLTLPATALISCNSSFARL